MQQDDRFSMIVVIAVTTVVVAVFFAVHGVPVGEPEPTETMAHRRPAIEVSQVPHSSSASAEKDAATIGTRMEVDPGVEHAAWDEPRAAVDDEMVRSAVRGVIGHPDVDRWLAPDRVVDRFVRLVDVVASGRVPEGELAVFEPSGDVLVREVDGRRLALAAGTYRRYDALVEMVSQIDPRDVAQLYGRFEPVLEAAYRRLGTGGGTFSNRLRAACEHLLSVPVPARLVEVEQRSRYYAFADHDLQALSDVQKHVVRMGRDNALVFQESLRRIARQLGWSLDTVSRPQARVAFSSGGAAERAAAHPSKAVVADASVKSGTVATGYALTQ